MTSSALEVLVATDQNLTGRVDAEEGRERGEEGERGQREREEGEKGEGEGGVGEGGEGEGGEDGGRDGEAGEEGEEIVGRDQMAVDSDHSSAL